jgi:TolA-binding protein
MLQLAFIHDKQGKHDQAMKEFAQVKKKFPKSVAARLADQQLKTSVAQ